MKIIRAGFGNRNEAFVEENFSEHVNIIYSDENNKGKTLLMQGILYAIGNEAIFPSGFQSSEYYFFVEILIKDKVYKFLRKKNSIVILGENIFRVCNSIGEFKRFINENVFKLPSILKDDKLIIVDPMLYYQMFFLGQDKRNSSNIINNGHYNKKDFFNMLCTVNGFPLMDIEDEEKEINKKISENRMEIKKLKKTIKFLKENSKVASFTNKGIGKEAFESLKDELNDIRLNITEYEKARKSAYIRRTNLEDLMGELRSISHNIKKGIVCCLNCGSKNISYTNGDISFDVSNATVRNEIMNSIEHQIEVEKELIDEANVNIEKWQERLSKEIAENYPNLAEILLYSEEIISNKECDEEIVKLIDEIKELERRKQELVLKNVQTIEKSQLMKNEILAIMNEKIKQLDPHSRIKFEDLFTKNGEKDLQI